MAITRVERERIADSRLKIQSVADTLRHVDRKTIEDFEEIEECLEKAEQNLGDALQSPPKSKPEK